MPERPLVSVITPTWQRPELLTETIEHVREQDYRELEHIVISDGPDDELDEIITSDQADHLNSTWPYWQRVTVDFVQLGRNWSGLMLSSFGIAPLLVGYLMARGEYIMPWCDDERALAPDHISRLVDLLETSGADFVYPQVRIWRNGNPDGPETGIIGMDPPRLGQITHYLFRASNLSRFAMPAWGTHPVDWSLVRDWMAAGATWSMLPECTFSHRLDQ